MKRIFDLVFSLFGVIILSPVLITIAALVFFKLGKPIFFVQKRAGKSGRPFEMIKFRTMSNERDENGVMLPDELRCSSFGQWLRGSSIDELPELFNVIKGDMSLVGPRPLLLEYLPLYNEEQSRRHFVKPGITGWAQINGRNAVSWQKKFELDTWYVDNNNLWLDLKILILTIKKVIKKEGISQDGEVTTAPFRGNKS